VTDIIPEAKKLRKDIIVKASQCVSLRASLDINIVEAKDRSIMDVLSPSDSVFRAYLFGTPLCEMLGGLPQYKRISYGTAKRDAFATYLCIRCATESAGYMPFLHLYGFFEDNKNVTEGVDAETLNEIAIEFMRYAESRFPAADKNRFKRAFRSSQAHSELRCKSVFAKSIRPSVEED
jgi:hypothetical protein